SNKLAVVVGVPGASAYSKGLIERNDDGVACTNYFYYCYKADLSVTSTTTTTPTDFSPAYLTITLREDASNIKSGTKIGSVPIVYVDASNVAHTLSDCASPTTPRSDGIPCIAKRTYYKNSSVPGWTADLDGDFEWIILNTVNGSYKLG